ncbi:MAG: acyltransferase [Ramlibacter sp.]
MSNTALGGTAAGESAPRNIAALTGFRFVAAMMVFFSHFAIPGLSGTAFRMTQAGYAGVTLFFVLSGFVIAYNYLERFEQGMTAGSIKEYLIARFARVYPLYFLLIVAGWLMQGAGAPPWTHLLAIQTWSADSDLAFSINGPAWSIGVEVFLYLMFPLLVPIIALLGLTSCFRRLQIVAALVALVMLAAALYFTFSGQNALPYQHPMSAHRWLYRTPVTRLGDFLLGVFGAIYFMRFARGGADNARRWSVVTWLCVVLVAVFMATERNFRSAYSWDVAYALPGILLIVGLSVNPRTILARILASPPLLLLGQASYALYLIHVPAGRLWERAGSDLGTEMSLYLIFVVSVLALSTMLHVWVERPARLMVRWWLSARPTAMTMRDGDVSRAKNHGSV